MGDGVEDPGTELAARLRALRLRRGLQMTGLQRQTGLGRTTISQALNGRTLPSEATLVALARALRTDAEPLLVLRRRADPGRVTSSAAPHRGGPDRTHRAFTERYLDYVSERHSQLAVVGLDLSRPERASWPLDAAYLSLELAERTEEWRGGEETPQQAPTVCRAEHALAGRRRILLKGLAGSGKTTLLQWLTVSTARDRLPEELAEWRGRVPFFLPLRTLVRRGPLPQVHEFLTAVGSPLAAVQPTGWADGLLSRDEGLILVDGVDEVPQEQRQATREWLRQLLSAYRDAAFVVTTRPSAVPEGWLTPAPLNFTELSVRPMGAADTSLFVSRWHAAARHSCTTNAERAHLDELEETLGLTVRAERDVAQLSTTPLMCALICALHRERRGHLPHSRMELYEAALSMLLVRRDRERGIGKPEGIQLSEHQSMHLLQQLAYWLIRNQQTEMTRTTAVCLLKDTLLSMPAVAEQGGSAEVLDHLVTRSGLLRMPTADTVDFVHRTFQDYLGAKAAVEALDFPLLLRHAHDTQWEDVVRMAIAHARPVERADLLKKLVQRGDEEEKHRARLHLLAAATLPYATEVSPQVRALVTERAAAFMPPRSAQEADSLADLGQGILDLLPRGADGLESDETGAVVRTAAAIGGDQAYALLKLFASAVTPEMRYELVQGWSNFDATDYAREVLAPLRNDLTVFVRTHAQLNALPLLTPIRRVTFHLSLTQKELTEHLSSKHTETIDIWQGHRLTGLAFARRLTALRYLSLRECSRLDGLRDLAGLPLPQLLLGDLPEQFSFDGLRDIPELTDLKLYTVLPWQTLRDLPAPPGLTSLWLGSQTATSLTGIAQWEALQDVVVNHSPDAMECEELAGLPNLTRLSTRDFDLTIVPRMPGITELSMYPERSDTRLDLIPDRFPGLKFLRLSCFAGWSPDLTPLHVFKDLRLAISRASRITGLEGFPPHHVSVYPRPRATDRADELAGSV
ncbi:NACHT domain-containing protein [Streptomyces sp. NPDC002668]|uniref:NACHT domain-containing protein n=1 Tax=Streptomyces sp. NPDC002668 TaxID=3154422 RepID=UPI003322A8D2